MMQRRCHVEPVQGCILPKKQRGLALITILLIVALSAIVAAGIVKHERNSLDNTSYLLRQNQSLWYARSAESFFAELLVQDYNDSPSVDYLSESWAKPMPAFPVEDGYVAGVLQDETGKFNLNSLVLPNDQVNVAAQQWLNRLLQRVGIDPEASQAIIDWQDANEDTSGAMGAESSYYQGLDPGFLSPNRKFNSIEELKQVRGFEGEKFALIAPYISALPVNSKLNINTAPALVLASIDPSVDVQALNTQLQQNQSKLEYFSSIDGLWQLPAMQGIDAANKQSVSTLIGVSSCCFSAKIEVMLSNRKRSFSSLMVRQGNQVYVNSRSLAPLSP